MTANRKVTARYAEIARFLGLHFNEEFCVAYREKDGFTLRVSGLDTGCNDWYETVKLNYGVDYCDAGGRSYHYEPVPNTWLRQ